MITRKDVTHIARLARIELSEAEKDTFEGELSAILDFVAKLSEVDTANVEPMAGGTELTNVMREDEAKNQESRQGPASPAKRGSPPAARIMSQGLVEAAPRKRNGYVEVEAVFERES